MDQQSRPLNSKPNIMIYPSSYSSSPSLQLPAYEYQSLLNSGQLTSDTLVNAFLTRIARHNHAGLHLNALISVCAEDVALSQAHRLDDERRLGKIRSPLHGIPIVIKDAIVTHPSLSLPTTAGAAALQTFTATRSAPLVERLLAAGLIILGKGNLTEFCGLKSENTPIGYSAVGGQTLSPYRDPQLAEPDQPVCGGSSSGPAVSIAAGFVPLAIGTETGGSNVFPASCNGLYGLTLPHGAVDMSGVQRISELADRIGLMARDPRDLEVLAEILTDEDTVRDDAGWEGLSIGILDSEWGTDPNSAWKWGSKEVKEKYASVAASIKDLGARVVYPLENPPDWQMLNYDGETLHSVSYQRFPAMLQDFLTTNFAPNSEITSLQDLVAWNESHADIAMPEPYTTQTELLKTLQPTMTPEKHAAASMHLRHIARNEGMAALMRDQHLDLILSSSDAALVSFSACAGWPIATVPVSKLLKNEQPWGFFALPREGRMDLLLQFMRCFHGSFERVTGPTAPYE